MHIVMDIYLHKKKYSIIHKNDGVSFFMKFLNNKDVYYLKTLKITLL